MHDHMTYMLKHPGHLTSMKNEFGVCTKRFNLWVAFSSEAEGCNKSRAYDHYHCTRINSPSVLHHSSYNGHPILDVPC